MDSEQTIFFHRMPEPEQSVLYIVGTPIGNLDDLSPRAINILKKVSIIACEDTRKTKKLLNFYNISNRLISLNQHNINKKVEYIVSELNKKNSLALVSDAGMPLISDPGELLVKILKNKGFEVICIPGPCAAITALVCSGIETSKFVFYGFLPRNNKDKQEVLESIFKSSYTSILYESPKRIIKLLNDLKNICGGEREIRLSRELTKKYEEHIGSNINQVLKHFKNIEPRGEFTIIVGGNKNIELNNIVNNEIIRKDLIELMNAGLSHSSASYYLSKRYSLSKNKIYNLIKKDQDKLIS